MMRVVGMLGCIGGAVALQAKPVIELSVASDVGAHAPVANAVAHAGETLAAHVKSAFGKIDTAQAQVVAEASTALSSAIAKALGGRASFANIEEPTLLAKLVPSVSDESAGVAAVESVESKREAGFNALVASGVSEMRELAKVIIATFEQEIRSHKKGSFLRYARELNVRVKTDPSFSTVSTLISNLETRRDAAESAVRAKILDAQMGVVKTLNRVGAAALASRL